jgi:predicted ATP-grasp superfamily ATP-dependent carboligase
MGVDLPAIRMLSIIQARLTQAKLFPVAQPDQLWMLDNKWSFYQFQREHHLPVPETVLVESMDQLEKVEESGLKFPLIVKPVQMEDGIGVRKLHSLAEARAHVRTDDPAHQFPLLFQEFIPGTDIDLSILADNGTVIAWTIQKWLPDGTLAFVEDEQILDLGRRMAASSQFHGVAHFDMRRDERDGSVKILECNPRFWATLRESMWNGTNFVERGIRLCTGIPAEELGINQQIIYTFPSRAMASLVKGDVSVLKRLSVENLQDAWQTISDPLTLAHKVKEKFAKSQRNRIQVGS